MKIDLYRDSEEYKNISRKDTVYFAILSDEDVGELWSEIAWTHFPSKEDHFWFKEFSGKVSIANTSLGEYVDFFMAMDDMNPFYTKGKRDVIANNPHLSRKNKGEIDNESIN